MQGDKISEHNNKVKQVFEFLNGVVYDTDIVYLNKCGHSIPLRLQFVISFSLLDVLASYWYEYMGKSDITSRRVKNWYNKYCLSLENSEYKKNIDKWKLFNAEVMYIFRNSVVHFLGLSNNSNPYIILAPNYYPDKYLKKITRDFAEKGDEVILLKPHDFHNLIKKGAQLMLNEWLGIIEESKKCIDVGLKHIAGIERVFNKIIKEGAVKLVNPSNID